MIAFLVSFILSVSSIPQIPSGVFTSPTNNVCNVTPNMPDCQAVTIVWRQLTGNKLAPFKDNMKCCNENGVKCTADQKNLISINWYDKSEIIDNASIGCHIAVLQKLQGLKIATTNIASLSTNFGKLTSLKVLTGSGSKIKRH